MKKFLFLTFTIVLATAAATPYLSGQLVEQNFRAGIAQLQQDAAQSGMQAELIAYQRNYLDTTATTRITYQLPDGDDLSIDIDHRVDHIPQPLVQVVATIDSELAPGQQAVTALAPLFAEENPLQVRSRLYVDGHLESTLYSPSAGGPIDDQATQVEWQGLSGSIWQSADHKQVKLELTAPGLAFEKTGNEPLAGLEEQADKVMRTSAEGKRSPQRLSLNGLSYRADLHRTESGLWLGDATVGLNSVQARLRDKQGEALGFTLDKLDFQLAQDETDGMLHGGGVVKAARIDANGLTLTDAVYDLHMENIDSTAFMALQAMLRQAARQPRNDKPLAAFRPHLAALINAQPAIHINELSVNSPMGRFAFSLNSSLAGEWTAQMAQNPMLILSLLQAKLDAELPRSVIADALKSKLRKRLLMRAALNGEKLSGEELEQAVTQAVTGQLEAMLQQGYIEDKQGQLHTRLHYDNGQLSINGKEANQLLGMMMQ